MNTTSAPTSTPSSPTMAAAREVVSNLKQKASDSTDTIKYAAVEKADEGKAQAADGIGRAGNALHQAADDLQQEDANIAHFAHRIADRLEGVSGYLRNSNFRDLQEDASRVARNHPVAFFGGLFLAGLVVGSVVKATLSADTSGSLPDTAGADDGPGGSLDNTVPQAPWTSAATT